MTHFTKYFIALSLCLLCSFAASAQLSKISNKNKLLYGQQMMREEQYVLSLDVFEMVIESSSDDYVPEALYFLSLAQHHNRNYRHSDSLLNILKARYTKWGQEADYLRGLNALAAGNYDRGIYLLSQLDYDRYGKESRSARQFYLKEIEDKQLLLQLHNTYRQDTVVATFLADKIARSRETEDKLLFDRLVKNYEINKYLNWIDRDRSHLLLERHKVALLLPFSDGEISQEALQRYAFIRDFYQGMLLAAQKLKDEEGIVLDLYTYNTMRSQTAVKELLKLPEMQGMDLLVGPVYSDGAEDIAAFSTIHAKATVNPFTNLKQFNTSKFVFSTEPSLEMLAERSADFLLGDPKRRRAIIFYSENPKDSLLAAAHYKAVQDSGGSIKVFKEITRKGAVSIINSLKRTNWDEIDYIYISDSNPADLNGVISALEYYNTQVPVLVPGSWIRSPISIDRLIQRQIYFLTPDLIDQSRPETKSFRKAFVDKYNLVPSYYAYRGYDMTMFFGQMLKAHGSHFYKEMSRTGRRKGWVMPGYDYKNSNSNSFVPVVYFDKDKIVEAK